MVGHAAVWPIPAQAEGQGAFGDTEMLTLVPVSFKDAQVFVDKHHRHHAAPQGHKYSIAVSNGEKVVGVVIVGRPVARGFDDGWTLEVTRNCTDGTSNAASMLYGAAWRAARAMGYRRMVTYTLVGELGISLLAAGWKVIRQTKGGSWNCASRPRIDNHPVGQKLLWEA